MYNTYSKTITYKDYFSKIMATMAIGLGVSGIIALLFSKLNLINFLYMFGPMSIVLVLGLAVGEIALGIYFSSRLFQMSKKTAWTCFIAYSALTGLSLSSILTYYSDASIAFAFATTAILFVCMSIIGRTTNLDFTKLSSLVTTGLVAMMIVSLLNSFIFHLYTIDLFISYLGIILFLFMIGYDAQMLDRYYNLATDDETQEKLMIMAAFQLYLDFINLFTRLLQMFGRRDNDRR